MPEDIPLRAVVGEDEPLVRQGVVSALGEAGFDVVAVAGDAPDLVRKAGAHKPDVVVADICMPLDHTDDGLRATQQIRESQPSVGVLVLSRYLEGRYALELVGDGAQGVGYLLKHRVGDVATFVIPPALQHFMAERVGARRTIEIPGASHAVSVSQPEATAELVLEAAGSLVHA